MCIFEIITQKIGHAVVVVCDVIKALEEDQAILIALSAKSDSANDVSNQRIIRIAFTLFPSVGTIEDIHRNGETDIQPTTNCLYFFLIFYLQTKEMLLMENSETRLHFSENLKGLKNQCDEYAEWHGQSSRSDK